MSNDPPFDSAEVLRQIRSLAERLDQARREFEQIRIDLDEVIEEVTSIQEHLKEARASKV